MAGREAIVQSCVFCLLLLESVGWRYVRSIVHACDEGGRWTPAMDVIRCEKELPLGILCVSWICLGRRYRAPSCQVGSCCPQSSLRLDLVSSQRPPTQSQQ